MSGFLDLDKSLLKQLLDIGIETLLEKHLYRTRLSTISVSLIALPLCNCSHFLNSVIDRRRRHHSISRQDFWSTQAAEAPQPLQEQHDCAAQRPVQGSKEHGISGRVFQQVSLNGKQVRTAYCHVGTHSITVRSR
jgi:hypothetical protein